MAIKCARCGAKQGMMAALSTDIGTGTYVCPPCQEAIAQEKAQERAKKVRAERDRYERLKQQSAQVLITTTPAVDGFRVARYIGIESVEFVIGTGVFSELTTELADFFGQRSKAFERKLQDAKKCAMDALKFIAAEQGANAVIGIDLDFTEFSGNRVALIANGTLVLLEPITMD